MLVELMRCSLFQALFQRVALASNSTRIILLNCLGDRPKIRRSDLNRYSSMFNFTLTFDTGPSSGLHPGARFGREHCGNTKTNQNKYILLIIVPYLPAS